jgi:hypothetical protein
MGDHWPLVVASGLVAFAAALGLWQHDRAVELAAQVAPPAHVAPAQVVDVSAEKADASQPMPAAPIATRAIPATTPPAPAVAEPAPAVAAPAVVAPTAPAVAVAPAAPAVVAPAPAAPTAPAVVPNAAPPVRQGRNATLLALRNDLQAQVNIAPMDTAGGGFAVASDGARLEVKPPPNWNIMIYNVNPKTPEVETDKFKEMLETTVKSLQIDMTPKPVESANGKTYLKTTSKLGSISLIRDPANGNSCLIGPIQQFVNPPTQTPAVKAPAVAPAAPNPFAPQQAQPVAPEAPAPAKVKQPKAPATPAAPPRAPATDANF